ncbi:MAG: hypothetical protein J6R15_00110 [Bacteroidales bacterium]|jgi:hypothetical protein|nr:hypothetical protein [Bacteroidales bacterium]
MDLRKLTLDELVGVVNLYPWFGGARIEMCERMRKMGDGSIGASQYADAALYVPSRAIVAGMMRASVSRDWTDADVERLLKSYISENESSLSDDSRQRRVHVVGGDYFSQDDYDRVRKTDDKIFSKYAAKAKQDRSYEDIKGMEFDIYTETLAQIYLEQGYPEQAKSIYSKLLLANPEKNAYFAALIEKIDELNQ